MKVTISGSVVLRSETEQEEKVAAGLASAYPNGAVVDSPLFSLGRAALPEVLKRFPGARVLDRRLRKPCEYDFPKAKGFHGNGDPKRYSIADVVAREGGVFVVSPQIWHRMVPNLIRNLARHSGQFVSVHGFPVDEASEKVGFSDWERYSKPVSYGDIRDSEGVVLAVNPDLTVMDRVATSLAYRRYVVVSTKFDDVALVRQYPDLVGPVLYSNQWHKHAEIIPIWIPGPAPADVVRPNYQYIREIALDEPRNASIAEALRDRGRQPLLLLSHVLAISQALPTVMERFNPVVIEHGEWMNDERRKAMVSEAARDGRNVLCSYDTAAWAGDLKLDPPDFATVAMLTPASVNAAGRALRWPRIRSGGQRMDMVVLDFLPKRDWQHRHDRFAKKYSCELREPVEGYA